MPSKNTVRLIRNLVLLGAVVIAYPRFAKRVDAFMDSDALAKMRLDDKKAAPEYAIRMEGVKMKHYDATHLITYAHADTIDLAADRHTYDLNGVHDAFYRGDKGEFRYSATHASYVDGLEILNADGKVRIVNKDFDLTTKQLNYEGRRKLLKVFAPATGTLKGGDFQASHISYDLDKGSYKAGPVHWKGKLTAEMMEIQDLHPQTSRPALKTQGVKPKDKPAKTQDPTDPDRPTVWDIQGDTVESSGNATQINTYTNAVATDGEIILIAPTVVHDRKTDVVTASGRVQYFSAKADLVADDAVIYRKEKRAVLTGNVLTYVKPKKDQDGKPKVEPLPSFQPLNPDQVKPDPPKVVNDREKQRANDLRDSKTVRDFPAIVVSAKVEYWYAKGSRRAVITGNPQARQELTADQWRWVWTFVAYYDGEKETLKMVSSQGVKNTRMKNSVGDDGVAEWMEVSTKEDDDSMKGSKFEGNMVDVSDDPDTARNKSNPPPAGGPPPATPPPATPPGSDPKKPPPG